MLEAKLGAKLKQRHVHASKEWIASIVSSTPTPIKGDFPQLFEVVYNHWLETDMAESFSKAVLPAESQQQQHTLTKEIALQIDSVLDVGESAFSQLEAYRAAHGFKKRGADTTLDDEGDGDESIETQRVIDTQLQRNGRIKERCNSTVLKLKLTDGHGIMVAMELEPLPFVNRLTLPGTKILFAKGTEIRRNLILATPRNCRLLGGGCPHLVPTRGYAAILFKCCGMDETGRELEEGEEHEGTDGAVTHVHQQTNNNNNNNNNNEDDDDDFKDAIASVAPPSIRTSSNKHNHNHKQSKASSMSNSQPSKAGKAKQPKIKSQHQATTPTATPVAVTSEVLLIDDDDISTEQNVKREESDENETPNEWTKGHIVGFGNGLKIVDGKWSLVVSVQLGSDGGASKKITASVDGKFLELKIGFSAAHFKAKRKEAKQNPELKKSLTNKLSQTEKYMKAKEAMMRIHTLADGTQVIADFIPK